MNGLLRVLPGHPSAVYGEDGAGDVVTCGGAKVESGAGQVLWLSPASSRDAFKDLAIAGFVGLQSFCVTSGEVARGNGVDLDALGCPLVRKGFGKLGHSAFACGVGGNADATLEAEQGGDIDDLAAVDAGAAAGDHVARYKLGKLKDAGQVDLKYLLPVFQRNVFGGGARDGAGVVDEDVDAAELFLNLGEEVFGPCGGGEVGAEGGGAGADDGGGFGGGAAVAVAGDGSPGLRERDSDGYAEPTGGACDESDFVVEAEGVEDVDLHVWHLRPMYVGQALTSNRSYLELGGRFV